MKIIALLLLCGIKIGGAWGGAAALAADAGVIDVDRTVDSETVTNPRLELKAPVFAWPIDLRPTWQAALQHNESDLRRQVADTIIQAHRYGMPGLIEMRDALTAVLETPGEQPVTRTAAAAALVEVDCRDCAALLAAQAKAGPLQLQLAVEPALARWDYRPARDVWLERLVDPAAHDDLFRTAAESLAKVAEPRAVEPLSDVLLSPVQSPWRRLVAARALAQIPAGDPLRWSQQLLGGVSADRDLDAQLGVELLAQQSSPQTLELLDQYARLPSPTVASVALRQLLELDPARVVATAPQTLRSLDANVREPVISALRTDPSPASVQQLTEALDDPVPKLRREARRIVLEHAADPALRPLVIQHAAQALDADSWRSVENAIVVLTELQHREINEKLRLLVDHPRGEVQIAAAWAIKHMLHPSDAPWVAQTAQRVTSEIDAGGAESRSAVQMHLFEALGLLEHRDAVDQLSKMIPKQVPYRPWSRAAAIWSLGFLLRPGQDAAIIRELEARLADAASVPAEFPQARAAAAIALGRIGDPASLPVLRHWYAVEGLNSSIGRSCGWAIMQMTGEPMPEAVAPTQKVVDWFLQPLASQ